MLSMPDMSGHLWPFVFVALLPILLRMRGRRYPTIFFIAFFTFIIYLVYVMSWIHQYGWQWLFTVCAMNSVSYSLCFVLFFFIKRKLRTDLCFILLPMLYTVAEYGKSIGFLSFPWPCLYQGQYENLHFIQITEFTGAWGVTFLLVWVNAAIFSLITSSDRRSALKALIPLIFVIAADIAFGTSILSQPQPEGDIPVTIVQRSESTQEEWTPFFNDKAWAEYRGLTLDEWSRNLGSKPGGFVVWPEGAIPDALIQFDSNPDALPRREQIRLLVKEMHKTFIIGTQDYDTRGPYNAAVVFGPGGNLRGVYRKVHIVPFGEVIPLEDLIKSWFPNYPWGTESLVDGRELKGIQTTEGMVGIVICYESFYPDLTRQIVDSGCDYLFLITNTSWFGKSKASYQHAHSDVFRAIENRMWLSRAATTGVSSFIDPYGNRYDETPLFQMIAETHFIYKRQRTTLYTRLGDWFPHLALFFSFLLLTIAVYKRNKNI